MRAAAEHVAQTRDPNAADLIAAFLPKERHRAGGNRLLRRANLRLDRRISDDLLVHHSFDAVELFTGDQLEVHEVEAEAVGRDKRAGLLDMLAEHFTKRGMKEMRRRVV